MGLCHWGFRPSIPIVPNSLRRCRPMEIRKRIPSSKQSSIHLGHKCGPTKIRVMIHHFQQSLIPLGQKCGTTWIRVSIHPFLQSPIPMGHRCGLTRIKATIHPFLQSLISFGNECGRMGIRVWIHLFQLSIQHCCWLWLTVIACINHQSNVDGWSLLAFCHWWLSEVGYGWVFMVVLIIYPMLL